MDEDTFYFASATTANTPSIQSTARDLSGLMIAYLRFIRRTGHLPAQDGAVQKLGVPVVGF